MCRYVGAFIVNQFASFFDENPPPQEAGTSGQGPSAGEGPPPGTMPNLTCLYCAAEPCKLDSSFPYLYLPLMFKAYQNAVVSETMYSSSFILLHTDFSSKLLFVFTRCVT
jgi:hypothetical protein